MDNKELTREEFAKSVAHYLTVQYFGYFLDKWLSALPHYKLALTFSGPVFRSNRKSVPLWFGEFILTDLFSP